MSDLPESLEQIEVMIASAKNYVVPSDNLRPRIMEAAREQQGHRLSTRRLLQVAAVVLFCVAITIPAQQRLDLWRRAAFAPSSNQFEIQAQQYALEPTIGYNWSLYEVYKNFKHGQFLKFNSNGK